MTTNSLPISSQVMKPASIILSPSERLAIRLGPRNTGKRPITAKRSLSAKKVLYAIFFSGEGVAKKVPVKKCHRKVLQRRSIK